MSELKLQLPPEEAALLLSVKLYEAGRLSLGKAAELAGYSKRTFMELLGKHGAAVYNYAGDELEQEFVDLPSDTDPDAAE